MSDECDKCGEHSLECNCYSKYYLSADFSSEIEVSKEKYIQMEEFCGFFSKFPGETATADFGMLKNGMQIKGRMLRHRPVP